jgi:hypothetical protein
MIVESKSGIKLTFQDMRQSTESKKYTSNMEGRTAYINMDVVAIFNMPREPK